MSNFDYNNNLIRLIWWNWFAILETIKRLSQYIIIEKNMMIILWNRFSYNVLFCISGSPWRVGIMPGPKMSVVGDSVRLVPAGSPALFELSALGFSSSEIDVQITSKEF